MTGVVTGINGDVITVLGDDDDTEKNYDLSGAEITREFPFAEGDQVEIIYPDGTTKDPIRPFPWRFLNPSLPRIQIPPPPVSSQR